MSGVKFCHGLGLLAGSVTVLPTVDILFVAMIEKYF